MDYDKTEIAKTYDAGRALDAETADRVRQFLLAHANAHPIGQIVDLGCGTGRFTGLLAEVFAAEVTGIEPSEKMLEKARAKQFGDSIEFVHGSAEQLPCSDESVDLMFLSMVLHHIGKLDRFVSECARVIRPGGFVCIRNAFAEEISTYPYLNYFPSIEAIIASRLISRKVLDLAFCGVGLEVFKRQVDFDHIAPTPRAFADKMRLRADSFIASLSDKEFTEGIARMADDAAWMATTDPVGLNIDMVLYKKTARNQSAG